MTNRHMFPLFVLGVMLFVTGCSTVRNPGEPIADLPPAPLPSPLPGDHYLFDDGHIERVQRIAADGVHWQLGGGDTHQIADADYTIPPYEWESPEGIARQTVNSPDPSIWPIVTGKTARHQALLAVRGNGTTTTYAHDWRCRVGDSERLTLPAGQFDTQAVTCVRRSDSGYHGHAQTWYHAPAIGHWVRKLDSTQGSWRMKKQRDLVAYRQVPRWLGLLGASQHESQLQASLERLQTGAEAVITTPSVSQPELTFQTRVKIERTYVTQEKKICRDTQFQDADKNTRLATFCRNADQWILSQLTTQ